MVAFRGRCSFRQYIPSKPARYGIKIWNQILQRIDKYGSGRCYICQHKLFKDEFDPSSLTEPETQKAVGLIISTLDAEVVMKISDTLLEKPKDILIFLNDEMLMASPHVVSIFVLYLFSKINE